ncbi:hypothetical protein CPB84DRAFT_1749925 [Gymnopilus junonius]|uniref:NAD(P)-binding protein n=1 Tax=Gymnopilus junonius TaxID=109634 RepID=A0A9P5NHE7_GYMJU|nr:hypothetical protein CPB84DRAFT_1749925 [Gymnopilus junonius]
MPSWLITGSSRGVGLALAQALLQNPSNFVIATARNLDVAGLKALASKYPKDRLQLLRLDVANTANVQEVVAQVSSLLPNGLDYLVNNAGVHPQPITKFEDIDLELFQEELEFDTIVPLRLTRALLPAIKKSKEKKILFITSAMGSFARTTPLINQCNAYSVGKTALNMLAHKWAASLKYEGVIVAAVHPGWVKTDIGDALLVWMSDNAPNVKQIEPAASGQGIVKVAEGLTLDKTGEFWNFDGTMIPW